jgi:hypothetical protein
MTEEVKGKGAVEIEFVIRDKDGNVKDREIIKVNKNGNTNH